MAATPKIKATIPTIKLKATPPAANSSASKAIPSPKVIGDVIIATSTHQNTRQLE